MAEKSAATLENSTGSLQPAVPLAQWPDKKLLRIGELADLLGVQTHVLRFWLQQFRGIRAERSDSGRLLFSRPAAERLFKVRQLLYEQGYTIAGAKRALAEVAPPAPASAPTEVMPALTAGVPAEALAESEARVEQHALLIERLQTENRALAARLAAAEASHVVAHAELAAVRARFANEWDEMASQLGDLAADIRG